MNKLLPEDNRLVAFRTYLIREEKSPVTVEKYMRDARVFLSFVGAESISRELTTRYKQRLVDRGYAPRSVNSMLAAVNSLLAFLGYPECRVKALRCQRQMFRSVECELTREEYLRLVNASQDQPRLCLALQTICSTGIRISELRFFTVEAVRAGQVTVRCKNKIRTILIPTSLRRKLLDYGKRHRIRRGMLFVTRTGRALDRSYLWASMKKLCVKARVDPRKVFPHNLRKLFARSFYALDRDIARLADVLGHSSIETTRIYIIGTGVEHRKQLERLNLVITGNGKRSKNVHSST